MFYADCEIYDLGCREKNVKNGSKAGIVGVSIFVIRKKKVSCREIGQPVRQ